MILKKPITKLSVKENRLAVDSKITKQKNPKEKKLTFKTEESTERKVLSLMRDGKKFRVIGRKTIIVIE